MLLREWSVLPFVVAVCSWCNSHAEAIPYRTRPSSVQQVDTKDSDGIAERHRESTRHADRTRSPIAEHPSSLGEEEIELPRNRMFPEEEANGALWTRDNRSNPPDHDDPSKLAHPEERVLDTAANCTGTRRPNERYSSSFLGNATGREINVDDEFEVAGEAGAKKTSSVHVGEDITLCWIETTTINEDRGARPPKRLVVREFTISFENSATIPERYLECARLEGEVGPGSDLGKTALFEVIDENTRMSRVVNFTTVSHAGDLVIWQHKRVRCGVGPVVSKNIVEWSADGAENPKKRVEIKVSPKMHRLLAEPSKDSQEEPCTTEEVEMSGKTVTTVSPTREFGGDATSCSGSECGSAGGDGATTKAASDGDGTELLSTGATRATATTIVEGSATDAPGFLSDGTSLSPEESTTVVRPPSPHSEQKETPGSSSHEWDDRCADSQDCDAPVPPSAETASDELIATMIPNSFDGGIVTTQGNASRESVPEETSSTQPTSYEERCPDGESCSPSSVASETAEGSSEGESSGEYCSGDESCSETSSTSDDSAVSCHGDDCSTQADDGSSRRPAESSDASYCDSENSESCSGSVTSEEIATETKTSDFEYPKEISWTKGPSIPESWDKRKDATTARTVPTAIVPTSTRKVGAPSEATTLRSTTAVTGSATEGSRVSGEMESSQDAENTTSTSVEADYRDEATTRAESTERNGDGDSLLENSTGYEAGEITTMEIVSDGENEDEISREKTERGRVTHLNGKGMNDSVDEEDQDRKTRPQTTPEWMAGATEDASTRTPEIPTEETSVSEISSVSESCDESNEDCGFSSLETTSSSPDTSVTEGTVSSGTSCDEDDASEGCASSGSTSNATNTTVREETGLRTSSVAPTSAIEDTGEDTTIYVESTTLSSVTNGSTVRESSEKEDNWELDGTSTTKKPTEVNFATEPTTETASISSLAPSTTTEPVSTERSIESTKIEIDASSPCDETFEDCSPSVTRSNEFEMTPTTSSSSSSCDENASAENCNATEPCDSSKEDCSASEETTQTASVTHRKVENFTTPRETENASKVIESGELTTAETLHGTVAPAVHGQPKHKLALKIRILLEHVNENKERQNLVEVEKHLLFNENGSEHGNHSLLEQVRSLNDSVSAQIVRELLNCSTLEKMTGGVDRYVSGVGANSASAILSASHEDHRRRSVVHDGSENVGPAGLKYLVKEEEKTVSSGRWSTRKRRLERVRRLPRSLDPDRATIEVVRRSLPGIREDILQGLNHVASRLSSEAGAASPRGQIDYDPAFSGSRDVVDLHSRRKRGMANAPFVDPAEFPSGVEEVDRWSNERVKGARGDRVRSLTEFTIYNDR